LEQIPAKLAEILDEFRLCQDTGVRADLLWDYAEQFKRVPEHIARSSLPEENRVHLCDSQVFVWVKKQSDNTIKLYFAVENPSGIYAKALASILDQGLSGLQPHEALSVAPDIVDIIFGNELSIYKGEGLRNMVLLVKKKIIEMI